MPRSHLASLLAILVAALFLVPLIPSPSFHGPAAPPRRVTLAGPVPVAKGSAGSSGGSTVRGTPLGAAINAYPAGSQAGTLVGESAPWVDLTGGLATLPTSRQAFAMAFDPPLGAVVLFGGQDTNSNALGDTWEFVNGSWNDLTSTLAQAPSARWSPGLTYDPPVGGLLLFGGRNSAGTYFNDTWVFNASGWTKLNLTTAPAPRAPGEGLVYDPADGYTLLHGPPHGRANVETWTFTNGSWTNVTALQSGSPPALGWQTVYDARDGYVLFFGGNTGCTGFALTWTYHNNTWTNLSATAGSPTAKMGAASIAYDPSLGAVVMFGGYTASCAVVDETWGFANGSWADLGTPSPVPPGVWDGRLAYDPAAGGDVLFGGNGALIGGSNSFVSDTWLFEANALPPVGSMTATPAAGAVPLSVAFASGPRLPLINGSLSYNWSFGDRTPNATSPNASHTYSLLGRYAANLTVTAGPSSWSNFTLEIVAGPVVLGDWKDLSGGIPTTPTPRQSFVMEYDPLLHAAVLFGGQDSSGNALQDTWEFAQGTWTQLSPPQSPSARWGAAMVYDPAEKGLVLFGGRDQTLTYFNDTWLFNATGWFDITPSGPSPSPRNVDGRMVYDAADGYVLLSGGGSYLLGGRNDTWTFANGVWTNRTGSVTGALPETGFQGAYDATDGYVLYYGGVGSCTGPSATWTYRGGVWTDITSSAGSPTAEAGPGGISYDPIEQGVLITGGYTSSCSVTNETWLFRSGSWYDVTNDSLANPPGRWDGRLVFDPELGGDLLWGGNENTYGGSNTFLADTWKFADGLSVVPDLTPNRGVAPLSVNGSTSGSLGGSGPYSYNWSFGDGSANATVASPSHVSAAPGPSPVRVRVNDSVGRFGLGFSTVRVYASLGVNPVATPGLGEAPLAVTFYGNASGGVPSLSYQWTFGDGTSSSSATPTHTYQNAGQYGWNVTVHDAVGDVESASGTVQVLPPLAVALSASRTEGAGQLTTTFAANVSGGRGPYAYDWQFGDGSSLLNVTAPQHSFTAAGTYTVWLNVTDALGYEKSSSLTILVAPAIAPSGTVSPPKGTSPLNVQFVAAPFGGIGLLTVVWSFGDGSPNSTQAVVEHLYSSVGNFSATLTVTDAAGDTATQTFFIDVAGPLTLGLVASPSRGLAPSNVTFTATASGGFAPLGYAWSFGDGTTGQGGAATSHVYARAGNYTAILTVTDAVGTIVHQHAIVVIAAAQTVTVSANLPAGTVGQPVAFTVRATGGFPFYSYNWSGLPPGCSSADTALLNCTPTAAGNYSVNVTVTDAYGHWANGSLAFLVNPPSPSSGGSTIGGLSVPLVVGGLVAVVVGIAIGLLVIRRRRAPPPPSEESVEPEPPYEEPPPDES